MLNNILDELKLNALVITDPYNMRHVSGFRGGEGALYISATQKVLITDSRYTEQAGKESDFTVIEENRAHNRQTILKECMEASSPSANGRKNSMKFCPASGYKYPLPSADVPASMILLTASVLFT